MEGVLDFFVVSKKILSAHMDYKGQHTNSTNKNIRSFDHMSRVIVNSGIKIGDRNDDYFTKITDLYNYLLMIIFVR